MASADEIGKLLRQLEGKFIVLKPMVEARGDLARTLDDSEKELKELETKLSTANAGDLIQIESKIRVIDSILSLIVETKTVAQHTPKTRLERAIVFFGQSAPAFGIAALGLAFLFTLGAMALTITMMGSSSWQTITGGRAVLLLALTFGFVTFGGALLVTPLFAEGSLDERFRRSREIFLLFAGMFSTIVGFYFASAANPYLGAPLLVAETFDMRKAELQVAVAGGKAPYTVEVEYGEKTEKGEVNKKSPESLDAPGTVKFSFARESEWPVPMTIKVKDSENSKAVRPVVLQKDELLAEKFKEPKKEQKSAESAAGSPSQLTATATFVAASGILEVAATGGTPPYKVKAIYGNRKSTKPLPDITTSGGNTKVAFDKNSDWPLPMDVSITDSDRKPFSLSVAIDESSLVSAGFKKP
jgi:hypothetical protein